MQPIQDAWVFVDLPAEEKPVLAARIVTNKGKGQFIYGKNYLARDDAFALDPINLPLVDHTQDIVGNDGVPTVLLDAGPDNWGKRLMMALHTRHPQNKLEELLATKGTGVGAIRVSMSRTSPKEPAEYPPMDSLKAINENIQTLIESGKITPELLKQLEPGSSMGGARPKSVVKDSDGSLHIAKFTRPDDIFDQSKAEQMCYLMMRDCGINTAESELIDVAGRSVILVKRFDVEETCRRHFISAHALMYKPRVRQDQLEDYFSYPALSDLILKIGTEDNDREELFRRMVFNVVSGNTDDHLRNHGFLKNIENNEYRLSPAYDVVPQPSSLGVQAISVGPEGRRSSINNCLSAAKYFGLKGNAASAIVDHVRDVTSQWTHYSDQVELNETDRSVLAGAFMDQKGPQIDYQQLSTQFDGIDADSKFKPDM